MVAAGDVLLLQYSSCAAGTRSWASNWSKHVDMGDRSVLLPPNSPSTIALCTTYGAGVYLIGFVASPDATP